MSKPTATITLYGRNYTVNCDPGEEARLAEIVGFVEDRMREVAGRVGNTTESRLLMLTCLTMADQLMEIGRQAQEGLAQEEDLYVAAVEHLRQRIAHIGSQVGRA